MRQTTLLMQSAVTWTSLYLNPPARRQMGEGTQLPRDWDGVALTISCPGVAVARAFGIDWDIDSDGEALQSGLQHVPFITIE
jgi:hypothetical protein